MRERMYRLSSGAVRWGGGAALVSVVVGYLGVTGQALMFSAVFGLAGIVAVPLSALVLFAGVAGVLATAPTSQQRARWLVGVGAITILVLATRVWLLAPVTDARGWDLVEVTEGGRVLRVAFEEYNADDAGCSAYAGTRVRGTAEHVDILVLSRGGMRLELPRACSGPPLQLVEVRLERPLGHRELRGCRPNGLEIGDQLAGLRAPAPCDTIQIDLMVALGRHPIDEVVEGQDP